MRFIKLSLTALSAALIIFAIAALPKSVCFNGGYNYVFYCGTSSADCRVVRADGNAKLTRIFLNNVCGESAEFKELDIEKFLLSVGGEIVFSESAAGITNYYCSANLPYSVAIDGTEINLHIAVCENSIKVGTPIIFGGY
ncbi:MAG: hypothetical protein J1G07_06030 [Clostridiales bacterium]|nr:hypothetical protein [Clostridiales bacterium]